MRLNRKAFSSLLGKMPYMFLGYIIFALGLEAMIYSNLGASPWVVLYIGIANNTPLTVGQASQICGIVVLVIAFILGTIPGLGSIFSMYFIGFFMDIIERLGFFFVPHSMIGKLILLFAGVIAVGWGSTLSIRENLGTGPRDALMVSLIKKINAPIWIIRGAIEIIVLTIGYFLKGPVGIGTLITAGTLGISVQFAFKTLRYNAREAKHMDLIELVKVLVNGDRKYMPCNKTSRE